jgi:hypothetical protein
MADMARKLVDKQAEFDARLARVDLARLAAISGGGQANVSSPPFDNRFFNQFVNSPGFAKRLRRPDPAPTPSDSN